MLLLGYFLLFLGNTQAFGPLPISGQILTSLSGKSSVFDLNIGSKLM